MTIFSEITDFLRSQDIFDLSLFFFIGMTIVLLLTLAYKQGKVNRALGKANPKDTTEALIQIRNQIRMLEKELIAINNYLENSEKRLKKSVKTIELKRFNPFRGTGEGGNNSFSAAILDEEGNGALISTLYARGTTSVFGKPIKNFQSEIELSQEEKEVIQKAKKGVEI